MLTVTIVQLSSQNIGFLLTLRLPFLIINQVTIKSAIGYFSKISITSQLKLLDPY